MTATSFLKQNWMLIVAGLLVIAAVYMIFQSMKKERYYDYEMAGCSTCSAGDAGVLDHKEAYQTSGFYSIGAGDNKVMDDDAGDVTGDAGNDLRLPEDITFDAGDDNMHMNEETGATAVADNILSDGFDDDEANMNADTVFAEQVVDGEGDVDMLEIDELDADEKDYSEL